MVLTGLSDGRPIRAGLIYPSYFWCVKAVLWRKHHKTVQVADAILASCRERRCRQLPEQNDLPASVRAVIWG